MQRNDARHELPGIAAGVLTAYERAMTHDPSRAHVLDPAERDLLLSLIIDALGVVQHQHAPTGPSMHMVLDESPEDPAAGATIEDSLRRHTLAHVLMGMASGIARAHDDLRVYNRIIAWAEHQILCWADDPRRCSGYPFALAIYIRVMASSIGEHIEPHYLMVEDEATGTVDFVADPDWHPRPVTPQHHARLLEVQTELVQLVAAFRADRAKLVASGCLTQREAAALAANDDRLDHELAQYRHYLDQVQVQPPAG